MQLILHGQTREQLRYAIQNYWTESLGYGRSIEYASECIGSNQQQAIAKALPLVATLLDPQTWLTAMYVLGVLHALPDPLVVELPPGVYELPVQVRSPNAVPAGGGTR